MEKKVYMVYLRYTHFSRNITKYIISYTVSYTVYIYGSGQPWVAVFL